MKYSGTIVGFKLSYGSIYNIIIDDTKCYAWKANVIAEINENMITISFNWNGESYKIRLSQLKRITIQAKFYLTENQVVKPFFGDLIIIKA